MLGANARRPFWVPFDFTAIAIQTGAQLQVPISQTHFLVHKIATWNSISRLTNYNLYNLEIFSRRGGWRLMDEPVYNMAFESDCRTPFRLPSPLYVPPLTDMTVRIFNDGAAADGAAAVTIQGCLVGELVPEKPVITKAPYMYSFVRRLGFADPFTGGAPTTTLVYDQWPTQSEAKPALLHDFELCAVTIDDRTRFDGGIGTNNVYNVTIKDSNGNKLFRQLALSGNVFGGLADGAFSGYDYSFVPPDYPTYNVEQAIFDPPFVFKKCTQLEVDISICPLFESSNAIHLMQQKVNVLLIGNHLYEPGETA